MRVRLRAAANGVVVGSKGGKGEGCVPSPFPPFGTSARSRAQNPGTKHATGVFTAPARMGHRMIDASSPTEGGHCLRLARPFAGAGGVETLPSDPGSLGSRFARRTSPSARARGAAVVGLGVARRLAIVRLVRGGIRLVPPQSCLTPCAIRIALFAFWASLVRPSACAGHSLQWHANNP